MKERKRKFVAISHNIFSNSAGHIVPSSAAILSRANELGFDCYYITGIGAMVESRGAFQVISWYENLNSGREKGKWYIQIAKWIHSSAAVEKIYKKIKAAAVHRIGKTNADGQDDVIKYFVERTERIWRKLEVTEEDIIYFPYIGLLEVKALVHYLYDGGGDLFHWPQIYFFIWERLFPGPDIKIDFNSEIAKEVINCFQEVEKLKQRTAIHFFTDSYRMTWQYNQLTGGCFTTAPMMSEIPEYSKKTGDKFTVVCPGRAHREKGFLELNGIVKASVKAWNGSKALNFMVQAGSISKSDGLIAKTYKKLKKIGESHVTIFGKTLSAEEYSELMRQADVVLLPYRKKEYFAGTSGPYSEAVSSGIPVIVPIGTWMSSKLMEVNYTYYEELLKGKPEIARVDSLRLSRTHQKAASIKSMVKYCGFQFEIPDSGDNICFELLIRHKNQIVQTKRFESARDGRCAGFVRLDKEFLGENLDFYISRLYTDGAVEIRKLSFYCWEREAPMGGAGVAYGDMQEIPEILSDMYKNYPEYIKNCRAYKKLWNQENGVESMVRFLIAEGSDRRRDINEAICGSL